MAATLDPGTQAGIGAFAGLVEVSVNQPLHTLKNFTQDGRVLPMNPAVWYRGWSAGVLIGVPMAVVQFGGSRSLERAITQSAMVFNDSSGGDARAVGSDDVPASRANDVPASTWSTRIASAALAGAVSGAMINPLDVCMTQQQKFGGSLGAVATRLFRTHGAAVATRAAWATMAREGFYACGYLCAAPWLRDRLDQREVDDTKAASSSASFNGFVAAASAGAAAGVLTQPVDTVKTLMQSNLGDGGVSGRRSGLGYVETAMDLVRRDGASALWRGVAPRAMRIASATFVFATVNELVGAQLAGASWVDGEAAANPS